MAKIIQGKNRNKPYTVRWYDPKQHERSFPPEPMPKRSYAGSTVAKTRSHSASTLLAGMSRARCRRPPGTARNYEYMLRMYLLPKFGDMPLADITREMCKDYLLDPELSRQLTHNMHTLLGAIFNEAIRDKRITENPVKSLKTGFERARVQIIPVTPAQLRIIEQSINPEWRLAVWLEYGCGLRLGESLAVRADGIREDGTVLRVTEQINVNRKLFAKTVIPLKHRKAGDFRDIPLPTWLRRMIEAHTAEYGIEDGGYLFPAFMQKNRVSMSHHKFHAGAIGAGIPEVHPHMLRHVYASILISAGVPIDSVSKYLGHRTVTLTSQVYSRLSIK